jgi:hypothetical protein
VAPLFATGFHIFYTPYHIMTSLITEIKHVVKKQAKILHPGGSRLFLLDITFRPAVQVHSVSLPKEERNGSV